MSGLLHALTRRLIADVDPDARQVAGQSPAIVKSRAVSADELVELPASASELNPVAVSNAASADDMSDSGDAYLAACSMKNAIGTLGR